MRKIKNYKPASPISPGQKNKKGLSTEVIIPIDTINDIYSDFDLRTIESRSLSTDFIYEVKNQSRFSDEALPVEIRIFAPNRIKDTELTRAVEQVTKKRITLWFHEEMNQIAYERQRSFLKSIIFITSGLACFVFIKYITRHEASHLFFQTLFELLSFFSWFSMWHGIDTLFEMKSAAELRYAKRLADAKIHFKFIRSFNSVEIL